MAGSSVWLQEMRQLEGAAGVQTMKGPGCRSKGVVLYTGGDEKPRGRLPNIFKARGIIRNKQMFSGSSFPLIISGNWVSGGAFWM